MKKPIRECARWLPGVVMIAVVCMSGCKPGEEEKVQTPKESVVEAGTLEVTSPAFANGETMPKEFTADGDNVSPPLEWRHVPEEAKSIALICEDPDAPRGTFTHWVISNVDARSTGLPRGVPTSALLQSGARQGKNDLGTVGYSGPAPPPGSAHRYCFRVYALDQPLVLEQGAGKAELLKAMKGHVLAQGEIMARYGRSK